MPVMDEFREEREALKNANFKTKWQYFLDYYKWPVIITAAIVISVISIIYTIITAKDYALNGYFLNTYADTDKSEAFQEILCEDLGIDSSKYMIYIDSSLNFTRGSFDESTYASSQKIMATMAASDTDFLAADEDAFAYYATTDTFFDLREIYTDEELTEYSEYIYYIDMDAVRARSEAAADYNPDLDITIFDQYDHFAPEEMSDPIPIAFCIEDSAKLEGTYYFREGHMLLGIPANTQRLDTVKQFVAYLLEEPAEGGM